MFWSLSLQLMPGETMIEESKKQSVAGVQPAYSVHLTSKRVVFRFNTLGSSMTQSFLYDEIADVRPVKRMFIVYLEVKTASKAYYLNVPEPAYWTTRILAAIRQPATAPVPEAAAAEGRAQKRKQELHDILTTLRSHGILTEAELAEKRHRVDSLRL